MTEPTPHKSDTLDNCCGGPAVKNDQACCKQDEIAKNSGEIGCGCSDQSEPSAKTQSCCN